MQKYRVLITYYHNKQGYLEVRGGTFWEESSAKRHRDEFLGNAAALCHPIKSAVLEPV
jgi:hypothetical protein